MAPKMVPAAPYKPTDFNGVGTVGVTPMTLEVNAAGKFKTIGEFMAYAKAHPDQVTVGHSGNGTTNHETILLLEIASGVKFNVVAYRGSGPAINDLLGGQIDAMVDQLSASLPYIRDGKFRAIAITTKDRSPDLPDVPTLTESGQDVDTNTATGLLVPAKTPASVVAALNKALNETIQDAEVQTRLRELGATPLASTTDQFADMLKLEEARAADLIKRGLLTVQ
jgi:tripartite-type tricarboxylate transporter receptor subunit TctC